MKREAEGDWRAVSDHGGSVVWIAWDHDIPAGPFLRVADDRAGRILAATLNACSAHPIGQEADNRPSAPGLSGA